MEQISLRNRFSYSSDLPPINVTHLEKDSTYPFVGKQRDELLNCEIFDMLLAGGTLMRGRSIRRHKNEKAGFGWNYMYHGNGSLFQLPNIKNLSWYGFNSCRIVYDG